MRYYSDVTKKFYDDKASLEKEEMATFAAKKAPKKEYKGTVRNEKKVSAARIDDAEKALKKAYELEVMAKKKASEILEKTQEEAAEIISKGNEEAKKILDEAKEAVKVAQNEKFKAIRAFNDNFGTYTKTITDEEAEDEYDRLVELLEDVLDSTILNLFR